MSVVEVKKSMGYKMAACATVAVTVVAFALIAHPAVDLGIEEHVPRFLVSETKLFQLAKNSRVKYSSLSGHHQRKLFEEFQTDFGKAYKGNKEEKSRLQHFKDFLVMVDERNALEAAAGTDGLHGITKFADLSQGEFEEMYLGSFKMIAEKNLVDTGALEGEVPTTGFTRTADAAKDWQGTYVTGVNDQGTCGASWAFAALEQIESDAMRSGVIQRSDSDSAKLAYQQAVSCFGSKNQGCAGGYSWYAYDAAISNGGVAFSSEYPYMSGTTGKTETCNTGEAVQSVVALSGSRYFYNKEVTMQDYVLSTGPLAANVNARTWNTYISGTMSAAACAGWEDDDAWHSVQITGVDLGNGMWKVRNSWGTDWVRIGSHLDACISPPSLLPPLSSSFSPPPSRHLLLVLVLVLLLLLLLLILLLLLLLLLLLVLLFRPPIIPFHLLLIFVLALLLISIRVTSFNL